MRNREDLETRELEELAPVAVKAARSKGRREAEPPDGLRTCFQRDRDRILHSTAFRRLQRKTQVLMSGSGDHFRTRLVHSLEVSQMARSASLALRLNPDLAEAVALAHDLGHPPFGHVGEERLQALMEGHGGFRHNGQVLRLVDILETRGCGGSGLNLCWETRICLLKKTLPKGFPLAPDLPPRAEPYLEGRIVDACDRIAYLSHDLDDALRSGIMHMEDFLDLPLCAEALEEAGKTGASRSPRGNGTPESDPGRKRMVSALVKLLLRDLVVSTARAFQSAHRLRDPEEARREGKRLVGHSRERSLGIEALFERLNREFYRAPRIRRPIEASAEVLNRLYRHFRDDPRTLPESFRRRIDEDGPDRCICDYLAGMTDDFIGKLAQEVLI